MNLMHGNEKETKMKVMSGLLLSRERSGTRILFSLFYPNFFLLYCYRIPNIERDVGGTYDVIFLPQ